MLDQPGALRIRSMAWYVSQKRGLVINFTGQVSNGPNKLITIKLIAMEPKMNKGDLNGSSSEPKGSKINPERRQVVLKGIKKEPKGVNNVPKDRASEKGAEIC